MKRVFKTKTFDRWARKVVSDTLLCQAAREIEQGLFEADLGAALVKSVWPLRGRGKVALRALWLQKSIKMPFTSWLDEKKMHLELIFRTKK